MLYEKHGMYGTPEYNTWRDMKKRCLNKRCKSYVNYGGRGIKICARWINSFPDFFFDVGLKPTSVHTLDRIDNSGNYEPSNVKWATRAEQARNQRTYKNNTSGHVGVYKGADGGWRAQINFNNKRFYLGSFATTEEAVTARAEAKAKYWP